MPHFTPYAASKAAVTSFAEALSGEVGSKGVTVTALCPGNVRTEFATVAEMGGAEDAMPSAITIDADACARAGLDGLEAGRRIVMPKPAVRALARFGRYAPRRVWLPFCRWMMSQ
jgi:short-subunit dehydrogenase